MGISLYFIEIMIAFENKGLAKANKILCPCCRWLRGYAKLEVYNRISVLISGPGRGFWAILGVKNFWTIPLNTSIKKKEIFFQIIVNEKGKNNV